MNKKGKKIKRKEKKRKIKEQKKKKKGKRRVKGRNRKMDREKFITFLNVLMSSCLHVFHRMNITQNGT